MTPSTTGLPSLMPAPTGHEPGARAPLGSGRRRRKFLVVLGIGALVLGGVGLGLATGWGPFAEVLPARRSAAVRSFQPKRSKLSVQVIARGDLESSNNVDVVNQVEGQSTILYLKPEGSVVKQGELVCELDATVLKDNLNRQMIATQKAEADLLNATKTREVAEIALREYLDGTYPQELKTLEGELDLAKKNLTQAEVTYKWSTNMAKKGFISPSQNRADRDAMVSCQINLRKSETKIHVLKNYARPKKQKELEAAVEKARVDELAKRSMAIEERNKEDKLRDQIAKCRLTAPVDGLIVYDKGGMRRGGMGNQTLIEEGATVRQYQKIINLPDITKMQVNAKVAEESVDQVAPGQKVRLSVDAARRPLTGTVDSVRPMADAAGRMGESEVRVYTVLIAIDDPPPTLRPGMAAVAEILVDEADDVLAVPMTAVVQFGGKDHVFVVTPEGPKLREVRLGTRSDRLIAVVSGLREGETVALEPLALMTPEEKTRAFIVATARNDDPWGDTLPDPARELDRTR